jgi:lantibiotic biosynthesis protein
MFSQTFVWMRQKVGESVQETQQHESRSLRARSGHWAPILDGVLADQARDAIAAIADSLSVPPPGIESGTLAGGHAGVALFYAYLARAGFGGDADQIAEEYLESAIDVLARQQMFPSLYSGFSGVAWAAAHLSGPAPDVDEEDLNQDIDAALLTHLRRSPWRREYDLISGLVGLGVYALERLPRPVAAACLEQVVARLDETAERHDDGTTWLTEPRLVPPSQRAEAPNGYYNLGLAHGVPGAIALLGAACASGVAAATARPLLDGAVAWLLAQRLPAGSSSHFSYWAGPGIKAESSRLAWCYGDLGLAAALLYAARCVGDVGWEREALAIARTAAARPPQDARVIDAGLCHGAAGAAHIFNRLYQSSGDETFADAARFWCTQTLALRQPGQGTGFLSFEPVGDGKMDWRAEPGLLTGAAGVGLALLAATTSIEPTWDRMLLVAVPPLGR